MTFMRNKPGDPDGGITPPFRPSFTPTQEPEPAPDISGLTMSEDARGRAFERDPRTSPTPPERCVDVIAAGSRWKGNLNVQDSVRIDGQISGEVEAKGTIHISEGAQVEAKLKAAFVVISGAFKGEVKCLERLELLPKSKVQGELETKMLNVHEGAIVDGTIRMSTEKPESTASNGSRSRATAETNGTTPVAASQPAS